MIPQMVPLLCGFHNFFLIFFFLLLILHAGDSHINGHHITATCSFYFTTWGLKKAQNHKKREMWRCKTAAYAKVVNYFYLTYLKLPHLMHWHSLVVIVLPSARCFHQNDIKLFATSYVIKCLLLYNFTLRVASSSL